MLMRHDTTGEIAARRELPSLVQILATSGQTTGLKVDRSITRKTASGCIGSAAPIRRGEQRTVDRLWHRQASSGCFQDSDPANGRPPMSAVPRIPVGGNTVFRLPVRPVMAVRVSRRTDVEYPLHCSPNRGMPNHHLTVRQAAPTTGLPTVAAMGSR